MSFERYRTFVTAASYSTFLGAANELHISNATVSKHIAALESELGVALFERHPHGVVLTEIGKEKLVLVRELLKIYDALISSPEAT